MLRVGVDDKVKAVFNPNPTKHEFAAAQMMENLAIPHWIVTTTKCHLTRPSKNARKRDVDFAQKLNFSVKYVAVPEAVVTIF